MRAAKGVASSAKFHTVPWAPGLETRQLTRLGRAPCYVALRTAACVWQLGIRKGFGRDVVKARVLLEHPSSPARVACELGMLEENCARLAEEMLS